MAAAFSSMCSMKRSRPHHCLSMLFSSASSMMSSISSISSSRPDSSPLSLSHSESELDGLESSASKLNRGIQANLSLRDCLSSSPSTAPLTLKLMFEMEDWLLSLPLLWPPVLWLWLLWSATLCIIFPSACSIRNDISSGRSRAVRCCWRCCWQSAQSHEVQPTRCSNQSDLIELSMSWLAALGLGTLAGLEGEPGASRAQEEA
mmetsp:Transcript_37939/g.81759  ORF Transcript_37939/g.81759 Transcript_37939/m.81759 type:complete len:204 (+) Transcript_37939:287-898(+)